MEKLNLSMVYTVKGYVGDIVCTREDGSIEYHRQDCKELQHYTNIQVINRFMISGETLFSKGLLSIEGNTPRVVLIGSMKKKFRGCRKFNSPLDMWDTSRVTVMSGMFAYAVAFNQPLNGWDTSRVTDMSCMFCYAESFNQSLQEWDTSRVIDMAQMFYGAYIFNQFLDNWDIDNVIYMSQMFTESHTPNRPFKSRDDSSQIVLYINNQ
jgi:surface protein